MSFSANQVVIALTDPAALAAGLTPRLSGETVLRQREPMSRHTTLKVGGPADLFVEPCSEQDLAVILKFCAERSIPILVIGRGSNLLVKDGGIRGVVVCLRHPAFSLLEVHGQTLVCGAGAKLKDVAATAKQHALTGLEFLEGIPGSVGGALRMNAGAMGSWIFGAVASVKVMDARGEISTCFPEELKPEYRGCPALKHRIALSAVLRAAPGDREAIQTRMNEFSRKRWGSQPAAPSAGCIFKNPASAPAGKLIDELGLKGLRMGGAVVSAEHGNFIVNDGKATSRDVLELIACVQENVRLKRGIELETEVEVVGE